MNTATFRTEARRAAENLQWAKAAELMEKAIASYPTVGNLANTDIARMRKMQSAWLEMSKLSCADALDDFNYVGSRHHY